VRRRRLSLKEPVEERPPVVLVHGDVPGELRHRRAPRLPGEERHPVALLLASRDTVRATRMMVKRGRCRRRIIGEEAAMELRSGRQGDWCRALRVDSVHTTTTIHTQTSTVGRFVPFIAMCPSGWFVIRVLFIFK
jgi:hypothetical protein